MSTSIEQAARQIVENMRRAYSAPFTMVSVSETEFAHLELAKYQSFRRDMEANGFWHVTDLEILEISQSPTTLVARTMIRSMISEDGQIVSSYYQVKPHIWRRVRLLVRGLLNMRLLDAPRNLAGGVQTRHCIGFETEFDDGRFLITSNAQAAALVSGPPTIESKFFRYGTSSSSLLDDHRARLREILSSNLNLRPVILSSSSDLLQMHRNQSTQKAAHRAAVQWITKAELQGMSAGNPDLGNEMFAEVERLLKDARSA